MTKRWIAAIVLSVIPPTFAWAAVGPLAAVLVAYGFGAVLGAAYAERSIKKSNTNKE